MEVASPSSLTVKCICDDQLTDISGSLSEDVNKLRISEAEEEIRKLERSWSKLEESVELDDEAKDDEEEEEDDEEEEEFSFACINGEGSPITADEAFEDGQIRPVFPLFNRDLLLDDQNDIVSVTDDTRPRVKLFVEDRNGDGDSEKEPLGPYCSWSGGTVAEASSSSSETCKKSNSTGFSKLWRFRDLVLRSNSDGRDAFVFLNNNNNNNVGDKIKTKKGKDKTSSSSEKKIKKETKSAHEKLYMRNRALREEGKHKSYLPYKQVGFFTNVNGLSRNIHPF